MKAKLNLNGAAIKNFFINNGEKLILAATVVILFSFAYGAITAKPIPPTKADEIKSESTAVQGRINEVEWDEYRDGKPDLVPVDYRPLAEKAVQPEVAVAKLDQDVEWAPPIFKALGKRPDPKILPPIELQAIPGSALVAYARELPDNVPVQQPGPPLPRRNDPKAKAKAKDPRTGRELEQDQLLGGPRGARGLEGVAGLDPADADRPIGGYPVPGARAPGQEARPKFYTVVTGLVPYEEQYNEYKRRFEDAMGNDPNNAQNGGQYTPSYLFFRIQRAEVKDHRDDKLDWKTLDISAAWKDWELWAQSSAQNDPPIDPMYSFAQNQENEHVKWLEWPLPPLYLKDWGFEVTHPKVPFYKPEEMEYVDENLLVNPLDDNPMGPLNQANPNARGPGVMPQPRMNRGPTMGRGPMMGRGMMGEFGGRFPGGGMRSPMMGRGFEGEMGMGGYGQSTAPAVPYKLYRYVDLTCDAGKRYRYRVQLVLNNPNYYLPVGFLEQPESANQERVASPWSEPTPVVEVPMNAQVLAASVAGAPGAEPEASVNLLALAHWKKPEEKKKPGGAAAAAAGADLLGGQFGMMNMEPTEGWVEVLKEFRIPLGAVAYFSKQTVEKVVDMSVELEKKKVEDLTFNANAAMLLDIRNDDPLGGKSKGPTEMLFFDKDGRLIAASSAVDNLAANDYKDRTFLPENLDGMGIGPGGGFEGEFMMPRGRFGPGGGGRYRGLGGE